MFLEYRLSKAAKNVARHVWESGIDTILVSGNSSGITKALFDYGWSRMYPESERPEVIDLGVRFNRISYKVRENFYPSENRFHEMRRQLISQYPGLLSDDSLKLYLDDHVSGGGKMRRIWEYYPKAGIKNVCFAVFAAGKSSVAPDVQRMFYAGVFHDRLACYFHDISNAFRFNAEPDLRLVERTIKKYHPAGAGLLDQQA